MNTGRKRAADPKGCLAREVRVEDLDTGEIFCFRLVPGQAQCRERQGNRVYLDTPLGQALIGQSCGSVVHWTGPSGMRRFMITSVDLQDEPDPAPYLHG